MKNISTKRFEFVCDLRKVPAGQLLAVILGLREALVQLLLRLVLSSRRLHLCRARALMRHTLGVGGQEADNCVIVAVDARRSVPVSVGFRATRCRRPIRSAAIIEGVRGLRTCTRAQARQIRPSGLRSAAVRRQISPFLRGNDRAESTDSGRASHKSSAVTKEAGAW